MPRGARRRDEIVAVAEGVFLAGGFAETTMHEIATRAGASKETLYRHFGSKEGLFAEVMGNRTRLLRGRLEADLDRADGLAIVLRELGMNLLEHITSPEVTALLRLVVSECGRDPALGRIFYTIGPEQTHGRLAAYLEAADARGECRVPKAALAADIFLGAVASMAFTTRLVLPNDPPMSRAEIEERVDEAVTMFMLRYGPADPRPADS